MLTQCWVTFPDKTNWRICIVRNPSGGRNKNNYKLSIRKRLLIRRAILTQVDSAKGIPWWKLHHGIVEWWSRNFRELFSLNPLTENDDLLCKAVMSMHSSWNLNLNNFIGGNWLWTRIAKGQSMLKQFNRRETLKAMRQWDGSGNF